MASRAPFSIRTRLNMSLIFAVTLLLLGFGYFLHLKSTHEYQERLAWRMQSALSRLSTSLPDAIWEYNKNQIEKIISSEMSDSSIEGVMVRNGEKILGGVGRSSGKELQKISKALDADDVYSANLFYADGDERKAVGEVTIYSSRAEINHLLKNDALWQLAQLVCLDILLLTVLSHIIGSVVIRPLGNVSEALKEVGSGVADLTKRLPSAASKEFIDVAEGFNRFVHRLNEIVMEVRGRSDSVVIGTEEIANGNLDLSNRTELQASLLQQTLHAVDALTIGVASNAENSKEAHRLALKAQHVAEQGGTMVNAVVNKMRSLNEGSKKIGEIVGLIDGIAFQTNILALNAAVEAARAGEQGRGFAVVASEVRMLAQRSAQSAKEIKTLISKSAEEVHESCKDADATGSTMTEVVHSIQNLSQAVQEIAASTAQQSTSIEQLSQAISAIDHATQQNAALVEQSAAAAGILRDSAAGLMQAVSTFRVDHQPAE